jgi:drug/metabolite transporter (DMT)-like permease
MFTLFLIAAAAVVVGLGDYLTKRAVTGGGPELYAYAWLCYALVPLAWLTVMSTRQHLGKTGVIWTVGGMLLSVSVGHFVFGETMSVTNKVGVLLCIVGVVMTSL